MADNLEIEVFKDIEPNGSLLSSWLQLLESVDNYRFYQHPSWIDAVNKHLVDGNGQIVLISDEQKPVAVLPVVLQKGLAGSSCITVPRHDHITLGDWIIDPTLSPESLLQATGDIADALGASHWSHLFLTSLTETSTLFNREEGSPLNAEKFAGYKSATQQVRTTAWFDTNNIDEHLSKKLRKNLRNRRRKATALGEIEFTVIDDADGLTHAFEDFLKVEASGWKGDGGSGTAIMKSEQLTEFYQALVNTQIPGITPCIHTLKIGDTVTAVQLAMKTGAVTSLLKIGFREDYRDCAPGSILLEEVLDHAAADNENKLVSLVTAPDWASRWHPHQDAVYNYKIYNSNLAGHATTCRDKLIQLGKRLRVQTSHAA